MWKIMILMLLTFSLSFADYKDDWNDILRRYTTVGKKAGIESVLVDYAGIKGDPIWKRLIKDLETINPSDFKGEDLKAFWINAYNIGAIKVVIDNHPLESIKDAGSLLRPVWDRDAIVLGGKNYSLGYIEHDILRKTGDSLIHYAIVCASMSCPDLRRTAYTGDDLEAQMSQQRALFLKNSQKGYTLRGNTYYISKIFKWFEEDFGDIHRYLQIPEDSKIKYLDYNWSLNSYTK